MADPADEYLQTKDASWLFPSRGPDAAEQPAPQENAANAEAVPYRPLRFLRRNKTAPEAGVGSCSPSSSTEDCGAAAGAKPRAVTGNTGGAGAGATPTRSVPAGSAPALSAPASPAPASQPQRPLAFALGALPSGGSAGSGKVPAGSAAQQQQAARPLAGVPTHSFSHLDSSQDLEAGLSGSLGKSSDSLPSAGGKAAGGSAPAAPPSRPAFGTLHLKLPGAPPGGSDASGKQSQGRKLVHTRVEPKTFFANERTFLQWLQISVLILMTATSMLSGTGLLSGLTGSGGGGGAASCDSTDKACFASKLSGAIIAPVGLLFMAYALYQYRLRTYQILRRETARYDDQRGTTVLTVILASVFILAYVLSMVFMF